MSSREWTNNGGYNGSNGGVPIKCVHTLLGAFEDGKTYIIASTKNRRFDGRIFVVDFAQFDSARSLISMYECSFHSAFDAIAWLELNGFKLDSMAKMFYTAL